MVKKGAFHYGRIPPGLTDQSRHAYLPTLHLASR